MPVHKLQINDFVVADYKLIALYSPLEDYRLAYFINSKLQVRLEKHPVPISIKIREGEGSFSRFIYDDEETGIFWNFIQNKNKVVSGQPKYISLFEETGLDIVTKIFLIPEFRTADYILKIEYTPDDFETGELVHKLLTLKHITTACTINQDKLKSRNNLIF